MARGEGAEQYAATLLPVKPINTEIKAAKVSERIYLFDFFLAHCKNVCFCDAPVYSGE